MITVSEAAGSLSERSASQTVITARRRLINLNRNNKIYEKIYERADIATVRLGAVMLGPHLGPHLGR